MVQYRLIKTTITLKNGVALKSNNICTEVLKSFDNKSEVLNELEKYNFEISKLDIDGVECCIITEYIAEKVECTGQDNKAVSEFVAGKVADLSKLNFELVPSS